MEGGDGDGAGCVHPLDQGVGSVARDLDVDAAHQGREVGHEGAVLLVVQEGLPALDGGADGGQDGQRRGVRDVAGHAHQVVSDFAGGDEVRSHQ